MPINPKTRWNLIRILPYGIIWMVIGKVFMASDVLALGDNPAPEGAVKPNTEVFLLATLASLMMGLLVGTLEILFVDRLFKKLSLWKTVIFKFFFYAAIFTLVIALLYPVAASLEMGVSLFDTQVIEKFKAFWGSVALLSTALQLSFSLLLCLLYGSISENLGHSVLVNFFTGKYHTPKQEERIFLFLDMYDSTTIAESLGHITYFKFLQQYYDDLADAIIRNGGEVYQYVGDEIVITWPKNKGIQNNRCIQCFLDMKADLERKSAKYQKQFGYNPRFKGGMHLGTVTTGEVGALKKEIVYTGDVLNTAARIQGLCKTLGKDILFSEALKNVLETNLGIEFQFMNEMELRGKKEKVRLYSIS